MQHEDITRADICLSPALAIGEGWYGLEEAADDGRSFRWSSARSCLRVDLDLGALLEDGSVVLHLGSPAGDAPRQIVMRGSRGTAHHEDLRLRAIGGLRDPQAGSAERP